MENKTGKPAFAAGRYFKYAIGEIVLVVIGILIALSINNWNSLRNNKALERTYLRDINTEFKDNKAQFAKRLNFMTRANNISENFIKKFPITEQNIDSILEGINGDPPYLSLQVTFDPSSSSIKSLTNSPSFNIIGNLKLKKLIIEWSDLVLDYKEEESLANQVSEEIMQFHLNTTSLNYKFEGILSKDDKIKLEKLIYWKAKRLDVIVDTTVFRIGERESDKVMAAIDTIIALTEPYTLNKKQ